MVLHENLALVFVAGLVTALATGIGALSFLLFDSISNCQNVVLWGSHRELCSRLPSSGSPKRIS
jgi:hypothetical protein